MTESLFLQAFKGVNQRVPVWFMRQAGRYLPAYQDIRKKHSLQEMFQEPEIAAQVTFQPVGYLNVDAAILFADILTLPAQMGFDIKFDNKQGPLIGNPLRAPLDVKRVHDFDDLSYVERTILLVNAMLPQDVPLIGFAGAPFTVAAYLIDGGSSVSFTKTFEFMMQNPKEFHQLLRKLTVNTIRYLKLQKKAGIKVFQVFDTWGGTLAGSLYREFELPYLQDIFKAVDLPSIYYLKNAHHLLPDVVKIPTDFVSVCQTVDLADAPILLKSRKGVQGNLFNALLYSDYETLEQETLKVLRAAAKYKKFIFNLSHGVFPTVDPAKLKFIADVVHQFPWHKH